MMAQARFKGVHWMMLAFFALAPTAALAQQNNTAEQPKVAEAKTVEPQGQTEAAQTQTEKEKVISGMSVLGNQDAPKSLVIVPWKGSEIGKSPGISTMLDDSRQPIDKEVFMRVLNYYEIRSQTSRKDSAPAAGNNAAPTTEAQRRKL